MIFEQCPNFLLDFLLIFPLSQRSKTTSEQYFNNTLQDPKSPGIFSFYGDAEGNFDFFVTFYSVEKAPD
jgi:hypothetical protein